MKKWTLLWVALLPFLLFSCAPQYDDGGEAPLNKLYATWKVTGGDTYPTGTQLKFSKVGVQDKLEVILAGGEISSTYLLTDIGRNIFALSIWGEETKNRVGEINVARITRTYLKIDMKKFGNRTIYSTIEASK